MTKAFYITAAELAQREKIISLTSFFRQSTLSTAPLQHWRSIHRERRALV